MRKLYIFWKYYSGYFANTYYIIKHVVCTRFRLRNMRYCHGVEHGIKCCVTNTNRVKVKRINKFKLSYCHAVIVDIFLFLLFFSFFFFLIINLVESTRI